MNFLSAREGETKQGASGPCTFSQRQGYIDLDLRNGDSYSLSPGNKADHYKDQKGNKVVRTQSSGSSEEFNWEGGKKIIVTFVACHAAGKFAQAGYKSGDTAPDLADLVAANHCRATAFVPPRQALGHGRRGARPAAPCPA